MHYQPEHIKKWEIVDIQQIKYKCESGKKPWAIQLNKKMLHYKDTSYSWTELNTDNSKISPWGRYLLSVQLKFIFPFFLGLSATIPSLCPSHLPTWVPNVCPQWCWITRTVHLARGRRNFSEGKRISWPLGCNPLHNLFNIRIYDTCVHLWVDI